MHRHIRFIAEAGLAPPSSVACTPRPHRKPCGMPDCRIRGAGDIAHRVEELPSGAETLERVEDWCDAGVEREDIVAANPAKDGGSFVEGRVPKGVVDAAEHPIGAGSWKESCRRHYEIARSEDQTPELQ